MMDYISAAETAKKWNITERAVRNYLMEGRVPGAFMAGKTWVVPVDAEKPDRKPRARSLPMFLADRLKYEKKHRISGGIYEIFQIRTAYFSNHMEGNRLSLENVADMISKNRISGENLSIDDVQEILNHYRAFNYIIDTIEKPVTEGYIEKLNHLVSSGIRIKRAGNDAIEPAADKKTPDILNDYALREKAAFDDILELHSGLMRSKPCRYNNAQVARLILFKECIRSKFIPFVIDDELKLSYYRGIREWDREQWYLTDTCRIAQDRMAEILNEYDILL
ncbi:MAG: cell filamentation protein Fic [Lachnospiraceae bacterium]|nr:cell filamentation protein Fic [Lachnospiraceae bacterium]